MSKQIVNVNDWAIVSNSSFVPVTLSVLHSKLFFKQSVPIQTICSSKFHFGRTAIRSSSLLRRPRATRFQPDFHEGESSIRPIWDKYLIFFDGPTRRGETGHRRRRINKTKSVLSVPTFREPPRFLPLSIFFSVAPALIIRFVAQIYYRLRFQRVRGQMLSPLTLFNPLDRTQVVCNAMWSSGPFSRCGVYTANFRDERYKNYFFFLPPRRAFFNPFGSVTKFGD